MSESSQKIMINYYMNKKLAFDLKQKYDIHIV